MTENEVNLRPTMECGIFIFYKPRPFALIISVLLIGLCFALGVWQIQRLHWKEGLFAELKAAQTAETLNNLNLPKNLNVLTDMHFRHVMLAGEFVHTYEFDVIGQYNRDKLGYTILTPFRIEDDGRMILVNRGWVPLEKKKPENRKEDLRFGGVVYVSGFLMTPQSPSRFMPAHDIKDNVWLWEDVNAMAKASGLNLPPVVVEQVNTTPPPNSLPMPRAGYAVNLRNDHMQYVFTWFSLAFAGLAIFFISHLKCIKGEKS